MVKITVHTDITLTTQQLLDGIAQLDASELKKVHAAVGAMIETYENKPIEATTESIDYAAANSSNTDENIPIVTSLIPESLTLESNSYQ